MCPGRSQRTFAQGSSAFKAADANATQILAPQVFSNPRLSLTDG
jgi:hypothetical protein